MPVRKFRSIEEMNAADSDRWLDCDDPELPARISALWAEWAKLMPPLKFPSGVHKFRSIEEMNAFRERHEEERRVRMRAERVKE
jgi:hypothetical protein